MGGIWFLIGSGEGLGLVMFVVYLCLVCCVDVVVIDSFIVKINIFI